jgi:hypothetical protein
MAESFRRRVLSRDTMAIAYLRCFLDWIISASILCYLSRFRETEYPGLAVLRHSQEVVS